MAEAPASLVNGDPSIDRFLDALAIEQTGRFSMHRLGPGERLRAAHLTQVLIYEQDRPEALRGALRAALSNNQLEAEVFDLVWSTHPVWRDPDSETRAGKRIESPAPRRLETETGVAVSAETEKASSSSWRRPIVLAAIILALMAIIFGISIWQSASEARRQAQRAIEQAGQSDQTQPTESATQRSLGGIAENGSMARRTVSEQTASRETSIQQARARRILDATAQAGFRPSPRMLGDLLVDGGIVTDGRSPMDISLEAAKATGTPPDTPLNLLEKTTLKQIYSLIHGHEMKVLGDAPAYAAINQALVSSIVSLVFETEDGEPGLVVYKNGSRARFPSEVAARFPGAHVNATGTEIATASENGTIRLWTLPSLTPIAVFEDNLPAQIRREMLFSCDERNILSYDRGGAGRLWNIETGQLINGNIAQGSGIDGALFSCQHRYLITWSADGSINKWSADTGRLLSALDGKYRLSGKPFLVEVDQLLVVSTAERIMTLDLSGAIKLADSSKFSGRFENSHSFLVNGTRILTIESTDTGYRGRVRNINLEFVRDEEIDFGKTILDVAFSADNSRMLAFRSDAEVELWDLSASTRLQTAAALGDNVAIHPVNGLGVLIETDADKVSIWHVEKDERAMENLPLLPRNNGSRIVAIPSLDEAAAVAARYAEIMRSDFQRPIWPVWLAAAIPLLLAGLALANPATWRRSYLKRRQLDPGSLMRKLAARLRVAEPLAAERRAVARLDQRHRVPSHRMDANATAEATARANGVFTPIMDTDAGTPEYVALIERRRQTDADAERLIAFFRRLKRAGLSLALYTYSGTPEALTPLRGGRSISLDTLRERHAGAFLLVSGDADRFHDLEFSGPARWTARLGNFRNLRQGGWAGGAFLARTLAASTAPGEAVIEHHLGMALRSTSASDLSDLADLFHGGKAFVSSRPPARRRTIPNYFSEDPQRLVREAPPGQIDVRLLVPELRAWLGDEGLLWLRSLAYYPVVQWDLARYLFSVLLPHLGAERQESLEVKVARLPWLEQGYMPDWVREALVEGMDPATERRVIGRLADLMRRSEEGDGGDVVITLGGKGGLLSAQRTGDAIFIEAMARTRARPWDLPPPAEWLGRMPAILQVPWVRSRLLITGLVLAAAAAWLTPTGTGAPVAQWLPLAALAMGGLMMVLGPSLALRLNRGRRP